jgi:presenilin-like A22 family membrane protease
VLAPVIWSSLLLIAAQVTTLLIAAREKVFVEENNFPSPQVGLQIPVIYFFAAVIVIGLILFLIPISKLRLILLILFAFIFSWGMFILLSLYLPLFISAPLAVTAGLVWLFKPKVWLHNLLLLLALVSVGLVYGYLLAPWTAMLFLLVIAVYDAVSVRFGHMMWMAQKLSESNVLPAFVIPRINPNWNQNLKNTGFKKLFEERAEREFSILGGGDIGFPLLLAVSVFFVYGYTAAIIVAAFSVVGLIGAYLVQTFLLKGKPTPALPTIAAASLIGFLIVLFLL